MNPYQNISRQSTGKILLGKHRMLASLFHGPGASFFMAVMLAFCAFSPQAEADWSQYEMVSCGKADAWSPPGRYVWTIINDCHETIRLAINFTTGENRNITKGWKQVPPNKMVCFKMNSEYIGYYAVSSSGQYHWWDAARPDFGVNLKKDFEYPANGLKKGRQKIQFMWISIIEEPKTRLTCN